MIKSMFYNKPEVLSWKTQWTWARK